MPIIKAKEFIHNRFSGQQEFQIRNLNDKLKNIDGDDTSLLKESLTKYTNALDDLLNHLSGTQTIQNAINTIAELPDFLKAGEFNTNYNLLLHDGGRNNNDLTAEMLNSGLETLKNVIGIEVTQNELEEAQTEKIMHAAELGIDPATKMERPVISFEVHNLEGIKAAAAIGKNFMDEGSNEYKTVDNMLTELNHYADILTTYINSKQDLNKAGGFEYEETVKLRDKLNEFKDAVVTIRNAGKDNSEVTQEQAENALKTVKEMPAFLMGSFDKTNYQRLADMDLNTNKLLYGLEALEKSLKLGINPDDIQGALAEPNMKFKANASIDQEKKKIDKNTKDYKENSDLLKETITKIMATRMAVNSELGKGKTLNVVTSSVERYKAEQKLLGNTHFQDFLSTIVNDPKKVNAAIDAATSGHGGGLDKMFTAYLKTRPAGELHNDPEIARYMPTIMDRLEFLQKKAAGANGKNQGAPVKEIAEIVALREIAGIKPNSKSMLKNQIPTNKSLNERVDKYATNGKFNTIAETRAVRELISNGHGGQMQTEIRNQWNLKKQVEAQAANEQAVPNKGLVKPNGPMPG